MPAIELDGQEYEFDSEDNLKTFVQKYAEMKGVSSAAPSVQSQPESDSLLKKSVKQVINVQPLFGGLNAIGDISRFIGGEGLSSISQQPTQTGSSLINELTAEDTVAPAAFIRGLGGTATFGQTPRIGALGELPFSDKDYNTLLQEQISREKELQQKAPISSLLGDISGLVLPSGLPGVISKTVSKAIPALKEIKGGSALANFAKGAARSGIEGGIGGAAYEAAQPDSTLESTLRGGTQGSLFGVGSKTVGKVLGSVADYLGDFRLNEKGAGKIINERYGSSKSLESLHNKATQDVKQLKPQLDDFLNTHKEIEIDIPVVKSDRPLIPDSPLSAEDIRREARRSVKKGEKYFLSGIEQKMQNNVPLTPPEAIELKTILNSRAFNAKGDPNQTDRAAFYRQVSNAINKQIEQKLPDAAAKQKFLDLNKKMENALIITDAVSPLTKKVKKLTSLQDFSRGVIASTPAFTNLNVLGNLLQGPTAAKVAGTTGAALFSPKKQLIE